MFDDGSHILRKGYPVGINGAIPRKRRALGHQPFGGRKERSFFTLLDLASQDVLQRDLVVRSRWKLGTNSAASP